MSYVAFLRGINVGGKSIIKMALLKEVFETCGMEDVRTFINSGNVIFETDQTDVVKISKKLEDAVHKTFGVASRIVILSHTQLKNVIAAVPHEWNTSDTFRCYIAFIIEPYKAEDVIRDVQLREGVDFVKKGPGVVYMSTLLSGLTKSGFTKLATKKVYQYLTIRNFTTAVKIEKLMEV